MSADLTGQRLGHYEIESILGLGGMSTVYRAIDTRLDRPVALKVISENLSADEEFRQRFVEEAKAASAIDHVNVVPLYDFGEADPWLFIAMRLVDGTDLARELVDGPLRQRRVLDLLGQVGAALDMLHGRGLVHLDVKPANILITRNESIGREHVYLADFGLTRRGAAGHRTASGDFLGSPTYASPEHLRGDPVLPSSDLYSLSCVLFSCLAGRAPFVGTVKEVVAGHLKGEVPSLSALTDLPSAIDRVIARGMAGDPTLRYGTAADLLGAARRAIADLSDDNVAGPIGVDAADRSAGDLASDSFRPAPNPFLDPGSARTGSDRAGSGGVGSDRAGSGGAGSGGAEPSAAGRAASPVDVPPSVRIYRPAAGSSGAAVRQTSSAPARRQTPDGPSVAAPTQLTGGPSYGIALPGQGVAAPAGPSWGGRSTELPTGEIDRQRAAKRHRAASSTRRPWPWIVVLVALLAALAVLVVILVNRG
ncbi:protein kinase [Nakamurella sp. A5-74]|uniref:non-specific serine/threonine protein kinase n=1 Tax=Nakamurella sp. A5-74 TaxID=3158264 RepID=A0AAU8DNP7_9ACTN